MRAHLASDLGGCHVTAQGRADAQPGTAGPWSGAPGTHGYGGEKAGELPRKRPRVPTDLGEHGRKLWRDVNAAYALRPDELRVLEQAARVLEVIRKLDAAMVGEPLTTKGSAGQVREHPLLSECRQQRAILARLLGQLGLPDEPSSSRPDSASHAARRMAHARWSRP